MAMFTVAPEATVRDDSIAAVLASRSTVIVSTPAPADASCRVVIAEPMKAEVATTAATAIAITLPIPSVDLRIRTSLSEAIRSARGQRGAYYTPLNRDVEIASVHARSIVGNGWMVISRLKFYTRT